MPLHTYTLIPHFVKTALREALHYITIIAICTLSPLMEAKRL